jgi:hypothetical protein
MSALIPLMIPGQFFRHYDQIEFFRMADDRDL